VELGLTEVEAALVFRSAEDVHAELFERAQEGT
jgi:hypothetical protein